jgi:hypothetical protein
VQPTRTPACAGVDPASAAALVRAYRNAGDYRATQVNTARGTPSRVAAALPPIAFTGPGQSSTLPAGPCQTIYRYAFSNVHIAQEEQGAWLERGER